MNKVLLNKTKTAIVFNVQCREGCGEPGVSCLCSTIEKQSLEHAADGTVGIRVSTKRIQGSLTILAGAKLEVPAWVLQSPEIVSGLARRAVVLIEQ